MPFLRAALLKKAKHEQEEEKPLLPPVVLVEEPEPEKLPDIDELLKVIDEKAKLEEEIQESKEAEVIENEIAELDEGRSDDVAEPEVVSGDTEDIYVPEGDTDGDTVSEIQEEEEGQEDQEPEIESEPESEPEPIPEPEEEQGQEPEPEPEQEETETEQETKPKKDYSGETLNYDFTSGKRYVDLVSTKTDFDRMLDELSAISGELLSHEVEKFAVKFTGKFQGDLDKTESDAKKYEAFLGGYITNAAMILYDNGYKDAAIKQLEQAKSILEARKKLEDETEAIRTRVEEENETVDLSDILGLFGD